MAAVLSLWSGVALGDGEYVYRDGKWVKADTPAEGGAGGQLASIRKLVKEGSTRNAIKAVESFLKMHPDDPGCEEAMLLAGTAEFNRGYYFQAFEWFERQAGRYPNGQYFERALSKMYDCADAFLNGKKRISAHIFYLPAQDDGLKILAKIAGHAPNSPIAEKSLLRAADYQYKNKRYSEAVQTYDEFVKGFSKSAKLSYAKLQAARATYSMFNGIEFDDTPLVDAIARYKELQAEYPDLAEKENVTAIIKTIRNTLGQKAYHIAHFYERTGKKDTAIFFYKEVINQYDDTPWGQKARVTLKTLGAKLTEETSATKVDPVLQDQPKTVILKERDTPPATTNPSPAGRKVEK